MIEVLHRESNKESGPWLAVNKPAGVSVHNKEGPENLLSVLENQLSLAPGSLYPAHRLDKETSGVQILALDENAARTLAEEFQKREVEKVYVGVLRGVLVGDESGVWSQPLSDKAEGRDNPAGLATNRVPCETRFRILQKSAHNTLCEFDLKTGRQHQIRKHCALARHALVGDPRYGDKRYNQQMAERYSDGRMFLHCLRLTLLGRKIEAPLPRTFFKIGFEASSTEK